MVGVDESLAFLFPGQGSQAVGMLGAFAATYPSVRETFAEAADVLGFDLWDLVAQGPEDELNRTENTQPALLVSSIAIWRVWGERTVVRPAWMAGHSLGEYSALVCSGTLEFADAVRLVRERGRAMQQAVPAGVGAMAAILGLSDELIAELCEATSRDDACVSAANFNSPGQVVIAGHAPAVQRLVELAKSQGAKRALMLPVSVPSHCPLMLPAAERLGSMLSSLTIRGPDARVVHNVDVAAHADEQEIREALVAQLHHPVRWSETIRTMAASGVRQFVECGPGKVLAGLNKRIVPECAVTSINDPESLNKLLESVS